MQGLDEKLKNANLDRETKLIIHNKVTTMDKTVKQTLDDRSKALEEKITATQKKK